MIERFRNGSTEKEALVIEKESKKTNALRKVERRSSSFINVGEIDVFMQSSKNDSRKKQKRLKMKFSFPRESWKCLPKTDPLFRIQVTLPTKERRDKTADDYVIAIKALLDNRRDSTLTVTIEQFRNSMNKISQP
ncbi:unnamed protein product [Lepeophtheirus salmonis]|uniref:(salmon louse) hypothetical protein n=1 Tax=Lepeophtheirus salmonis TaxID=72036 RepID=A0A7R8CFX3_LEPSM|nr:unnamed protein product [Lepeophtheirus salmonis]CAF2810463.1 unnamed protein product [Lepeophtheirus salmonis]